MTNQKPRVVCLRSNPISPDPILEKVAKTLYNSGYEVQALGWERSENAKIKKEELIYPGIRIPVYRICIKGKFGGGFKQNLGGLVKFQLALLKWLIKNRKTYEIIHAYDFDTAFIASKIARFYSKKLIYHLADYYADSHALGRLHKIIKKTDDKIINKADAVIICNESRKIQLSDTTPKRLIIMHNTPEKGVLPEGVFAFDKDKLNIAYVGILARGRGILEVADIVSRKPGWVFHIGGFGLLEEKIKELAKKYNNIKYYGKLPYDKTLALENSCDIMLAMYTPDIRNHVLASPNKFYEGLMLGTPLIMIHGTGMSKYIEKYNIGELANYSEESIESAIERIYSRKNQWLDISKLMKKLYIEEFGWDIMKEKLLSLYKEI